MSSVEKTNAVEKSDKIKIIGENVDDVKNTTVDDETAVTNTTVDDETAAMNEEMARKNAQKEDPEKEAKEAEIDRVLAGIRAAESGPVELVDIEDLGHKRPPSCCK